MKKIFRSKENKVIAGVCGGIAETFSFDPTLVRLILVFVALVTGVIPFLITYIIAWFIIPYEN